VTGSAGAPGGDGRVDVSVLIPTLNEEAHVGATIASLREQEFDGELEFLFIDGGSEDRTREILDSARDEDARIRVLDNPRRRTPFALNEGLRHSRGEFVARMDAHATPPADYLARGVERLRRGDVDWVSGPQLATGNGRWTSRIALALTTRLGVGGASFRNATEEIETDTGYLGVWRRRTLLDLDGWNEEWVLNQDSELAARVRSAGGRIVCVPEMAVSYTPRDSLRGLARQYWRYGQYRAKTSRAHPNSMRRSHVLPPGLVLAIGAAALPWRRVSVSARASLAAYVVALIATAVSRFGSARWRDVLSLPIVLVTMHVTWGAGFIAGSVRFGPPLAALARLIGLKRATSSSAQG
jgi:succinoglycan biosynthesis protein ExoA